ncbi:site-specific integrase [Rhizobium leguminosarum]|uniref:hypothetical protein n=1 Tax=Rhizobium leguminosarum TaxID=384 RepID=UPI001C988FDC|nr:hypothetical protein [Rhizobium leguminosarum]MBY5516184.1 hypothetical protein [Rhizobium leguminosarum]
MRLELSTKFNLVTSDLDGGCVVNGGTDIVLLREPSREELKHLFLIFCARVKEGMTSILRTPLRDVVANYGPLHRGRAPEENSMAMPYGTAVGRGGKQVTNLRNSTVKRGLINIGEWEDYKGPLSPGVPALIRRLTSLPVNVQLAMLNSVITDCDVGSYFRFDARSASGWARLSDDIEGMDQTGVFDFLERLGKQIGEFSKAAVSARQKSKNGTIEVASKNYMSLWFAVFLASQGVWLLPMRTFLCLPIVVPTRLRPLLTWLAVPEHARDIADEMLRRSKAERWKSYMHGVFLTCAVSSDMWRERRFCPFPLTILRDWLHSFEDLSSRRTSPRYVYFALGEIFDEHLIQRPEYPIFDWAYRNSATGGSFRWTIQPTHRNTKWVKKLIGRDVVSVPDVVRDWALILEPLIATFEVKYPRAMVTYLNAWLAFLMTLDAKDTPRSFRDIDPQRHGKLFVDFMAIRTAGYSSRRAEKTVSKMRFVWAIVAKNENFFHEMVNPFDHRVETDRSAAVETSSREAMDADVWAILTELNSRDDYAFARTDQRYWRTLKNSATGEIERVFWGAEPRILDMIFTSGFRLMDARWLDSGEGDEKLLNLDNLEYEPNPDPRAKEGCRQAFLRRLWLDTPTPRFVIAGWRIQDKSTRPKLVPYVSRRIADMVKQFALIQAIYNPLPKAVPFLDRNDRHTHQNLKLFPHGYPLFRDTGRGRFFAISEINCRRYARDFFRWAQPQLDERLGRHYPLMIDGKARFEIHDLRVTSVTLLVRASGDLKAAQIFIGHESEGMTAHYVADQLAVAHEAAARLTLVQQERAQLSNRQAVSEIVEADYKPDHIIGHVGLDAARRMLSTDKFIGLSGFEHGLCPGGDCMRGGPLVAGKPTPVWRIGACARCRFRVTGPRYEEGSAKYVNVLLFEHFTYQRQEKLMNEALEQQEREGGARNADRNAIRIVQTHRNELMADILAEIQTHQGLLSMKKRLGSISESETNQILVATSEGFRRDETYFSLTAAHEYELVQGIVDARIFPSSILETPASVGLRHRELSRVLMRATGLHEVLYRADPKLEEQLMQKFGAELVRNCSGGEIQRLIEGAYSEDAFPALASALEPFKRNPQELLDAR